jgi:hypothetical protein
MDEVITTLDRALALEVLVAGLDVDRIGRRLFDANDPEWTGIVGV